MNDYWLLERQADSGDHVGWSFFHVYLVTNYKEMQLQTCKNTIIGRIGNREHDASALCAVDALGLSPMRMWI